MALEGTQKKERPRLQFLADRLYDVEALREHLSRQQVLKVPQKTGPFTRIKEHPWKVPISS